MEHTTTNATDILKQRGTIYGSYDAGVRCRAKMMSALDKLNIENTGVQMPEDLRVMFSDLVLKMMRAVSCPSHIDSWVDLEGYAKLIKEYNISINKMNEVQSDDS